MIAYYKKTLKDTKLKHKESFQHECWINVIGPSEDEIKYLVENLHLDEQNLISGLDRNELPRIEIVDDNIYVILKIMSPDKKYLHTFLIIITVDFVLTLSKIKPDFLEKIIHGEVEFITTQKLRCLLSLFSMINKDFEKSTLDIVKLVNSKKESFGKLSEKDIQVLLELESLLNSLLSAYYHTNLLYERMTKKIKFFEEDKEGIEDLMIEAQQGFNLCRSSLKTISNIRNHFVILLSNQLNKIITLLTIFTVFISIPAAISGIYGMNVLLPLQENNFVFYYIILFIFVIWFGFIFYFKKEKIL